MTKGQYESNKPIVVGGKSQDRVNSSKPLFFTHSEYQQ